MLRFTPSLVLLIVSLATLGFGLWSLISDLWLETEHLDRTFNKSDLSTWHIGLAMVIPGAVGSGSILSYWSTLWLWREANAQMMPIVTHWLVFLPILLVWLVAGIWIWRRIYHNYDQYLGQPRSSI